MLFKTILQCDRMYLALAAPCWRSGHLSIPRSKKEAVNLGLPNLPRAIAGEFQVGNQELNNYPEDIAGGTYIIGIVERD